MNPIQETRHWMEQAVIGLNLCPFAKAVHTKGQIRWVQSEAANTKALLGELVHELQLLAASDPEKIDTTLLVHPFVLGDFLDYNGFLDLADEVLCELGLEGELQIASFHPLYQFEGSESDDMANFSNRSPYPTLHLLREASVERAVESFPEAEAIYEHNIETLERLGIEGWRQLMAAPAKS